MSDFWPRLPEESSAIELIALRPPLPFPPFALRSIVSLRHLKHVTTFYCCHLKDYFIETPVSYIKFSYLLCEWIIRGLKPITLADDCGMGAATDGVHFPL